MLKCVPGISSALLCYTFFHFLTLLYCASGICASASQLSAASLIRLVQKFCSRCLSQSTLAAFCQTRQLSPHPRTLSCSEPPTPGPPTFTHSPHLPLPLGGTSGGSTAVIKKAQLFKQLEATQRGWLEGCLSIFTSWKSNYLHLNRATDNQRKLKQLSET